MSDVLGSVLQCRQGSYYYDAWEKKKNLYAASKYVQGLKIKSESMVQPGLRHQQYPNCRVSIYVRLSLRKREVA